MIFRLSDIDTYLYRQQDKQDHNSHLELVLTDSLNQPSNHRLKTFAENHKFSENHVIKEIFLPSNGIHAVVVK